MFDSDSDSDFEYDFGFDFDFGFVCLAADQGSGVSNYIVCGM